MEKFCSPNEDSRFYRILAYMISLWEFTIATMVGIDLDKSPSLMLLSNCEQQLGLIDNQ